MEQNKNNTLHDPKEIFRAVKDADKISGYLMDFMKENELAVGQQSTSKNDYTQAIDDVIGGKVLDSAKIVVGKTPDVLKMLGVNDTDIYIHRKTILKDAIRKHNITADDLKQLPQQLNQPVAIMKSQESSSNPNAYVILTSLVEFEKEKQKPVIIALDVTKNSDRLEITSVYGRRQAQIEKDLHNAVYWDKEKGQKFIDNFGYQLPPSLSNISDLSPNIKTNDDLSQYLLQKNSEKIVNIVENRQPTNQNHAIQQPNPSITQEKTYLYVPYEDKDTAAKLGARWDKENGAWYAPAGSDLDKFATWRNPPTQISYEQEFAEFLRSKGVDIRGGLPIMDGRWHRVHIDGDKPNAQNANYSGWLDNGKPRGYFKNFKTGEEATWVTKQKNITLPTKSPDELQTARQAAEAKQQAIYDKTAIAARQILSVAPVANNHPYLQNKGVQAHGLHFVPDPSQVPADSNIKIAHDWREAKTMRESFKANGDNFTVLTKGDLLIPAYNKQGELTTFQTISNNGFKSYLKDAQKSGSFLTIGEVKDGEPVLIAEGYATGATLHEQLNRPVVVAFDSGNLLNTALAVRENLPNSAIYNQPNPE